MFRAPPLERLRCQRHDLHVLLVTQLASHGAEDAGALGSTGVVDQHGGVLVEADVRTVLATDFLLHANDDATDNVALLDAAVGSCLLDAADDDVAKACIAALGAAEDLDALHLARAGVVGRCFLC